MCISFSRHARTSRKQKKETIKTWQRKWRRGIQEREERSYLTICAHGRLNGGRNKIREGEGEGGREREREGRRDRPAETDACEKDELDAIFR